MCGLRHMSKQDTVGSLNTTCPGTIRHRLQAAAIGPKHKPRVSLGRNIVSESNPPAKQRWRPTVRQIIAAIIVVAALLFIFQNTHTGDFHFLWFDFKAPVWFWMLVVFAAGLATGLLLAGRRASTRPQRESLLTKQVPVALARDRLTAGLSSCYPALREGILGDGWMSRS